MITLKQWMETVEYRITEGSHFGWNCFGDNAYTLDSWDGDQEGSTLSVTFDTRTQVVYLVEAFDYVNDRAYRLINPEYAQVFNAETDQRGVGKFAWDAVPFIDLETEEDWLEKARAIFLKEDYDTRVSIPVEFTDEELLKYMTMAHEQDMTFNAFIEKALQHAIDEHKRDPEAFKSRVDRWKESRDLA